MVVSVNRTIRECFKMWKKKKIWNFLGRKAQRRSDLLLDKSPLWELRYIIAVLGKGVVGARFAVLGATNLLIVRRFTPTILTLRFVVLNSERILGDKKALIFFFSRNFVKSFLFFAGKSVVILSFEKCFH